MKGQNRNSREKNRDSRDKTGTSGDKTGTFMGEARKTNVPKYPCLVCP